MLKKIKNYLSKKDNFMWLYLALYFVVSLFFLTRFPAMHSDESWLSGLTRSMMNDGLGTTEYFFDLVPRYPHAIKIIYHILQMPFALIFGYNLFSFRLMSLLFGIVSLCLIYQVIFKLTKSKALAILGMATLSIDIQFMYASHFVRQEIVIVTFILAGIYFIIKNVEDWTIKKDIITGAIIGLSIGIHPNSFLVALILGAIYLYYIIFEKKLKLRNLFILIVITAIFAAVFVGISFSFNSNFINDYLKYGDDLGATASGIMKIFAFPKYYKKIFNMFSVTYYLPNIKAQLILFAIGLLAGLVSLVIGKQKNKAMLFILPILALNIGYLIIGRYSQPGIVLLFPLCYLFIYVVIDKLKRGKILVASILCILIGVNTFVQIIPSLNNEYDAYLEKLKSIVPKDAEVIANLNAEYAFEYDGLHDYRNLDKLDGKSIAGYIEENEIEYIIYPEEMDFIYDNRPVWNVLYGNVFPYYDDMQSFLLEECELVYEFNSPYAMRILMFSQQEDWAVKIYKVEE